MNRDEWTDIGDDTGFGRASYRNATGWTAQPWRDSDRIWISGCSGYEARDPKGKLIGRAGDPGGAFRLVDDERRRRAAKLAPRLAEELRTLAREFAVECPILGEWDAAQ